MAARNQAHVQPSHDSMTHAKPDDDSPDATRRDTASDSTFDELLSEVARAPGGDLFPPGAHLGEYEVVGFLGRGAFGVVYHASHRVIGKQVALKVLNSSLSADPTTAGRFVDEARAVNRISHPNIVDIFGFGALADGRKFCVMELLQGETLGSFVKKRGPLPLVEALPILAQIAAALDAAHASGIVHRDLKPDNVFLVERPATSTGSGSARSAAPTVKLLDFGIAQVADGLHQRTGSQVTLGTPAYMSPEQCAGGRVDHRSDIYALGLVAFKLLTARLPFDGSNAVQIALQQVSAEAPAPSAIAPELPRAVDRAIVQMLAKRADERPASASAAIAMMSDARTTDVLPRVAKTAKPWRVAGVMALGASLGLAAITLRPTAPPAPRASSEAKPAAGSPAARGAAPAIPSSATLSSEPTRVGGTTRSVVVRLEGRPATAKVFIGGREVGRLGQGLTLDVSSSPVAVTVTAPGYVSRELRVVPDRDQVVPVRLSRTSGRANPELEY